MRVVGHLPVWFAVLMVWYYFRRFAGTLTCLLMLTDDWLMLPPRHMLIHWLCRFWSLELPMTNLIPSRHQECASR